MHAQPIDAKHVERVAKALYDATKDHQASSWGYFVKLAQSDATARELKTHWEALAIAAIDMANGARARRWA